MIAEPFSIAEPPPTSCGHPLPSPKSVTSRKFQEVSGSPVLAELIFNASNTTKKAISIGL
jgi:hypothetical protein